MKLCTFLDSSLGDGWQFQAAAEADFSLKDRALRTYWVGGQKEPRTVKPPTRSQVHIYTICGKMLYFIVAGIFTDWAIINQSILIVVLLLKLLILLLFIATVLSWYTSCGWSYIFIRKLKGLKNRGYRTSFKVFNISSSTTTW